MSGRAAELEVARAELARIGREIERAASEVRAHRGDRRRVAIAAMDEKLLRRDELTRRVRRLEERDR